MPKLLFVIGSLSIGGAERHLSLVLPKLKDKGFDISIFCLTEKGELGPSLEAAGIKIFSPDLSCTRNKAEKIVKGFIVYRILKRYIEATNPDIVHMFLPTSYLIGGLCSFFFPKIKFLMSRRSLNYYQKRYPFTRSLEKFLHKRMTFILGNSNAVIEQLKNEGVEDGRLGLIYNGINADKYDLHDKKLEIRKNLNLPADSLIMVMVANLFPYKGHKDLIKALELVKDRLPPNWKLLLVGRDCGCKEALEKQIKKAGLRDNVIFMGIRKDIPEILNASDVGLSCSHEEGFSNSILEMMASSLAIVATNAGGNVEAVKDKETGLIVPIKDSEKISEALVSFCDNNFREKMGNAAKKRVQEMFSLNKCVEEYEKFYKSI